MGRDIQYDEQVLIQQNSKIKQERERGVNILFLNYIQFVPRFKTFLELDDFWMI